MSGTTEPFFYSYVREMRPPKNPGGPAVRRYRGRCSCGWTTSMHYSSAAMALGAARRVHNKDAGAHDERDG